ncbi:MAG: TldD/PmbA family protein [Thermoproteales archaeon]|nr:TldD/PmbA family protein [Thermoproteales archaeon]
MNLVEHAIKYGLKIGVDEVHAVYTRSKGFAVEVEMDSISRTSFIEQSRLGVIVFVNKRIAAASINNPTEHDVEKAVEAAYKIAKASKPNIHWSGLPEPKPYPKVEGLYDKRISEIDATTVVELMKTGIQATKQAENVSLMQGALNIGVVKRHLGNSRGIDCSEKFTELRTYLVAVAKEAGEVGSFAVENYSSRKLDIDMEQLGRNVSEKALESLHLKPIESFKGSVILDYDVSAYLFSVVGMAYNGFKVWSGSSPWKDKLGEKVAVDELTIIDDGTLPGGLNSASFDGEGSPTMRKVVIENGVLKKFINNTYTGRLLNMEATGNALSPLDVGPANTIVEPGDWKPEEMIRDVKKGILLKRFSGRISVEDGLVSGTAKQAFYIENGEKKYPVRECMVSGNLYEMLMNITAIGKETRDKGGVIVPLVKIDNVNIIGK